MRFTNTPCSRCRKAPRLRWPKHPNLCRECVRIERELIGGPSGSRTPIPPLKPATGPWKPLQEPSDVGLTPGGASQDLQPAKRAQRAPEPPKQGVKRARRRQFTMVSVEEARARAAALYGTYKPV